MKTLLLAALASTMLAACASTPTVNTDYDSGTQFGSYKTYSWAMKPEASSPLTQQRIVEGVDSQLRAKGLSQVDSGGDLAVAANVTTSQKTTLDTMYTGTGLGGWGWRGGWRGGMGMGTATTEVRNYDVGTLIVDLFDARTRQAVWRGTASGTVSNSPDKNAAGIDAGLSKMFASYPPGATQ